MACRIYNITKPNQTKGECQIGYTQYFPQTRSFTTDEWNLIKSFAKQLFSLNKEILANAHGEEGTKPTANTKFISFNGIGDESHETFEITKDHNKDYNFCKTNRKSYDDAVVAVLTYINYIAPNALTIDSDGSDEPIMFTNGTELVHQITQNNTIPKLFK